jgi:hypothetical protein
LDGWQNLKDFYNLINVYMDSVLHPAITPWTLKQEGWHYDIEDVYTYMFSKVLYIVTAFSIAHYEIEDVYTCSLKSSI